MEKINNHSLDITQKNIQQLKGVFPEVFLENDKIDFDALKNMLGEFVMKENERYQFIWPGKQETLIGLQQPTKSTLIPILEKSKNYYETKNVYIEGDNLEVLRLMQKSYNNKIKVIYIDPPYNTGKDFVYKDNFKKGIKSYLEQTGQIDSEGKMLSTNLESNGRFHTDWLNMMFARLKLAKNLLTDNGVIFISIDDSEQNRLKNICDEIFGEKNFVTMFPRVTKKGGKSSSSLAKNHDYILMYKKGSDIGIKALEHDDENFNKTDQYELERGKYKLNQPLDYDSLQYSSSLDYEIELDGKVFVPGGNREQFNERKKGIYNRADWAWRWSKRKFEFGLKNGFIVITNGERPRIYTKTYQNATISELNGEYYIEYKKRTKPLSTLEYTNNHYSNDNATKDIESIFGKKSYFDYTKPINLCKHLIKISTEKDDLVLDFFSGSATTAHATMQLNAEDGGNRKFIMVQLPEPLDEKSEAYKDGYRTICDIGEERIRRAGEKIKAALIENQHKAGMLDENIVDPESLDIGFKVFKLDTSNIREWNVDFANLENELDLYDTPFVDGRSELDIVYEIMLKQGLELTYPIGTFEINGQTVYDIAFGSLFVCLSQKISTDIAQAIIACRNEHGTETSSVIFSDAGFETDSDKLNCIEILKDAGYPEDNLLTL